MHNKYITLDSVIQAVKIVTLAIALGFGVNYAYAWTGPTATAPDGNISSPINVSGSDQIKVGGLWLGSLGTDGGASIGTTISSPQYCIGASCITTWPSGSTSQWGTAGSAIYYNGGNVGIGTASPGYKLDVSGSLNVTGSIYGTGYDNMPTFGGGGNGWYGAGTSNASGGATPVSGFYPYAINNHTGLAFSAHTAYGGIRFYNQPYPTAPMSATPAMQITNNNVSVANTLSVGGSVDVAGIIYSPSFRYTGSSGTIQDVNQFYCNNSSSCHFNYSGSGNTYVGNGAGTWVQGTLTVAGSVTATQFNTGGYYLVPNGNSYIYAIQNANGSLLAGWPGYTGLSQYAGQYMYPGFYSGQGTGWNQSYYLAGSTSWGLYSNTSLNAQGLYDSGNRVYSAVNPPSSVTNATNADNATYGRYVYNNGAYNGSGWVEASSLGVYYSYLGRLVYNNGAYSGSGWIEPSDLGVRYSNYTYGGGNFSTWPYYAYDSGTVGGRSVGTVIYSCPSTGVRACGTCHGQLQTGSTCAVGYYADGNNWGSCTSYATGCSIVGRMITY